MNEYINLIIVLNPVLSR